MSEDKISVIDAAIKLGMIKQTLFKIIKRLKLNVTRERSSQHGGQAVAYISQADFDLLSSEVQRPSCQDDDSKEIGFSSKGVFYLIQLEPDHDPGRFKLGFASNMPERLRHHRCAAPFAKVVATWPCHILWEKTAIDSITQGCIKIHTEVFRTDDINQIEIRCRKFFDLMPSPDKVK